MRRVPTHLPTGLIGRRSDPPQRMSLTTSRVLHPLHRSDPIPLQGKTPLALVPANESPTQTRSYVLPNHPGRDGMNTMADPHTNCNTQPCRPPDRVFWEVLRWTPRNGARLHAYARAGCHRWSPSARRRLRPVDLLGQLNWGRDRSGCCARSVDTRHYSARTS